mgnify:CR=1 FL=1
MRKNIVTLLLVICIANLFAQTSKTTETTIINKHLFYAHKVVKGQTLYRLSILYAVHVDTIISYNAQTAKGLAIDEIVYIPISNKEVEPYSVKQGETWAFIAKTRQISEDELAILNPAVLDKQNLHSGQILNVPILLNDNSIITSSIGGNKKEKDKNNKQTPIIVEKNQPRIHIVQQGETLFGIAKRYGVKVDSLKALNPQLTEQLSIGQQIRLPDINGVVQPYESSQEMIETITKEDKQNVNIETKAKIGQKKDFYRVYMFIPLYLSKGTNINIANIKTLNDYKPIKQFAFIQFYEALLLAVEDIEKQYPNIQIQLKIEDVNEISSEKMTQLINSGELQEADLIIGPFFGKEFMTLCQYAKNHDICIVNPFSITFDECGSWVYKATSSYYNQALKLAQYIRDRNKTANVIIVNNQSAKENMIVTDYKTAIHTTCAGESIPIQEINLQTAGIAGVKAAINPICENYILTFFSGEITITNFVQSLNAGKYENVTLVAPETWLNFDNIETEYFINLNTLYISQYFVDYSRENVISFLKRFREKYQIEPTLKQFAFQGYDITYYFLSSLCEKGTSFSACETPNNALLSTKYEFSPHNKYTLENTFVHIFKIKDYRYVEVDNNTDWEEKTIPIKHKRK